MREGLGAYRKGARPSSLVAYDPDEHEEAMKDMVTGLVGTMLRLKAPSLCSVEIGSDIPVVVTYADGDLLRILIDPVIDMYEEKGQRFVEATALSYKGEGVYLDTNDLRGWCKGAEQLEKELVRCAALLQQYSSQNVLDL